MKILLKCFLTLPLLAAFVSNVHAASIICGGTVDTIAYHQGRGLMVRLASMNTNIFICDPDAEWVVPGSLSGTTKPGACKSMYATLLSAKLTRAPIPNMYIDGNSVPAACNAFPAWSNFNVRYFDM